MFKLFRIILRRDLMLAFRRKSDLAQVIFFFAVVVTLVPLGVGAETPRFSPRFSRCRACSRPIMPTARSSRCSSPPSRFPWWS